MPTRDVPPDPHLHAAVLHRGLHALDRMERDSTRDRLAVVADLVAQGLDLPGWSAFSDEPAGQPHLVHRHMLRPVTPPDAEFDLRLGPVVDGFGLHANAMTGPAALQRRLASSEMAEILVVGGYAPDATRWVLEFYAEHDAPTLVPLLPVMYAMVQAALSFPHPARPARGASETARSLLLVQPKANGAGDAD
ncbi:hypothetical protein [Demetria terragena]|uniref:hypothetical protein n=1 Tax=Demetria terragena TaxID=63959 RepID=UPI0003772417|nr:hypothetical protein [Demetria terragena]